MSYCVNCGKEVLETQKFCTYCGHKINLSNTPLIVENVNTNMENIPYSLYGNKIIKSGFIKSIIGIILGFFPFLCVAGIVLSSGALKDFKYATNVAKEEHTRLKGIRIPTKIIGIVGLIESIYFTVLYTMIFAILLMTKR